MFKKIFAKRKFSRDYRDYKGLPPNTNVPIDETNLKPRLFDQELEVDYVYLYQDTWCVRKVLEFNPDHHYDVGSYLEMLGILAQSIPTTMVDIRPVQVSIPGLDFIKGDARKLPFADASIKSLSSICVLEHIGLGRYGDPLDTFGTEKAAEELVRVLAPGGQLLVTVPVDDRSRVYFNAHRAFNRDYILKLFEKLNLVEEQYLYKRQLQSHYEPTKGFGTGMFAFKKA